jgi:lysyl-tRNA synthetase class 1
MGSDSSAEFIQTEIYEIGKLHKFENLRDFFKLIYQVLLGQEQGPRLGSFIKLYGIEKTIKLIDGVLKSG